MHTQKTIAVASIVAVIVLGLLATFVGEDVERASMPAIELAETPEPFAPTQTDEKAVSYQAVFKSANGGSVTVDIARGAEFETQSFAVSPSAKVMKRIIRPDYQYEEEAVSIDLIPANAAIILYVDPATQAVSELIWLQPAV